MFRWRLSTVWLLGLTVLLAWPAALQAAPPQSGNVNVSAQVCQGTGLPPTITSPPDHSVTDVATLTLQGTGNPDEVMTVFRNGLNAGSTTTDSAGQWTLTISLVPGANTISAVNCPGQATITVTYNAPPPPSPSPSPTPSAPPATPSPTSPPAATPTPGPSGGTPLPPNGSNPAPGNGTGEAPGNGASPNSPAIAPRGTVPPPAPSDRRAPTPAQPLPPGSFILTTTQSVTEVGVGEPAVLYFTIEGGSGPYQITVIWDDGTTDRASVNAAGHISLTHRFRKAGNYHVTVTVRDRNGRQALLSYVVTVHSSTAVATVIKQRNLWLLFFLLGSEFVVLGIVFILWEYYHRRRETEGELVDEV